MSQTRQAAAPAPEAIPAVIGPALPGQHPDFTDADRHGCALDALVQTESSALIALDVFGRENTARAIQELSSAARHHLQQARKVIDSRERQVMELTLALRGIEQLIAHPERMAADLVGDPDRQAKLMVRIGERARAALARTTEPTNRIAA